MTNLQNNDSFKDELDKLSPHDRQEIETFIGYLKSRPKKELTTQASDLLSKVNDKMLEGYVKLEVDDMYVDEDILYILFSGRDKAISFPSMWFNLAHMNSIRQLHVKYRTNSNRIDKIAIDESYFSSLGKTEGKKRILITNYKQIGEEFDPQWLNSSPMTSVQLVSDIIDNNKSNEIISSYVSDFSYLLDDNITTPNEVVISIPKSNPVFNNLSQFLEGKPRLDRVAKIMFNFLDKMENDAYSWDSEFLNTITHDFTNVKTDFDFNETLVIKTHFRKNDCLEFSEYSLSNIDAEIIVSCLVEETKDEYKLTICGYIKTSDFWNKTKQFNYNEKVVLRSIELDQLRPASELFNGKN